MEPLWTPKKPAGLYKIFLEFTDPRPVGLDLLFVSQELILLNVFFETVKCVSSILF